MSRPGPSPPAHRRSRALPRSRGCHQTRRRGGLPRSATGTRPGSHRRAEPDHPLGLASVSSAPPFFRRTNVGAVNLIGFLHPSLDRLRDIVGASIGVQAMLSNHAGKPRPDRTEGPWFPLLHPKTARHAAHAEVEPAILSRLASDAREGSRRNAREARLNGEHALEFGFERHPAWPRQRRSPRRHP